MSAVNPEQIARELGRLWDSLGKQPGENGEGVLRSCTMTLIVLAEESDDPAAIWETLAALMPRHPSRAILVRMRPGSERGVDVRVFAQCWQPFGRRTQICCEQVEIAASEASAADVPGVVLPLAVADVPLFVWCRGRRMPQWIGALLPGAGAAKIIVDSAAMGPAAAALENLAARQAQGRVLADLSWTRLTRWRELIARSFADPEQLERLPAAAEVRVAFGGEAPPPAALYVAAWLLDGIQRAGGAARPRLDAVPGAAWDLRAVELKGPGLDLSVGIAETGCAEIRAGGARQRTAFPERPDYALLAEEAGIPGKDPVFANVLPAAARLGVSLIR